MTSVFTNACQKIAERRTERLEREILGAWRSGYDYLYRYVDHGPPYRETCVPAAHKIEHRPGTPRRIEYDLRDLTVEDVERVRNR